MIVELTPDKVLPLILAKNTKIAAVTQRSLIVVGAVVVDFVVVVAAEIRMA